VVLGSLFLELADQQLELLDIAVELFRRAAEAGAPQHRELHLQLLDVQRLGMDLRVARGDLDVLARKLRLQAAANSRNASGSSGRGQLANDMTRI
jgi:hypothetical protein